jgi:uncharacterized membrane protein (UPF0127 family)
MINRIVVLGQAAGSAVLVSLALTLNACAQQTGPMLLPLDASRLVVDRSASGRAFSDVDSACADASAFACFDVEVADDATERAAGLMFREDFPDNRAMVFAYDREEMVAFWMKNTPRPLDIIFVDAGGIVINVAQHTVPYSEMAIPSAAPAQFVIEINAGLAEKLGIDSGDQVHHPLITGLN